MKYFLNFCITFFTCLAFPKEKAKVFIYSGSLDQKDDIKMTLNVDSSGNVIGFYQMHKECIVLSGKWHDNKIELFEDSDYSAKLIQGFKGMISGAQFSGFWTDQSQKVKKAFLVRLEQVVGDEQHLHVTHYFTRKNTDYGRATLQLQHIHDEVYKFTLATQGNNDCHGFISGLLSLDKHRQGCFHSSGCDNLKISIDPKGANITETQCKFHGIQCSFDGAYVRQKR